MTVSRRTLAAVSFMVVAAACGTATDTDTAATDTAAGVVETPESSPPAEDPTATSPDAATPDPAEPGTAEPSTPPTEPPPAPPTEAPADAAPTPDPALNALPEVTVIEVGTGAEVNLASFVPSDRPLVLWFWAPH